MADSDIFSGLSLSENNHTHHEHSSTNIAIVQIVWASYGSLVFIFGLPGSVLMVIVLQRRTLRGVLSSFLTAVAAFDIIILGAGLPVHWLQFVFGLNLRLWTYNVCLYHRLLISFSHSCTSWLLVLVTMFRFYYLKSAGRISTDFTDSRARVVIIILVALVMVLEYVLLHERDIGKNEGHLTITGTLKRCDINNGTKAAWIRHSIVTYLPLTFLVAFTVLLFTQVRARSKSTHPNKKIKERARHIQGHLTTMLTLMNAQFLITNAPLSLYASIGISPFDLTTHKGKERERILGSFILALFYTGCAISIILFCLSGKRFRTELFKTFNCLKRTESVFYVSRTELTPYSTSMPQQTTSVMTTQSSPASTIIRFPSPSEQDRESPKF